MKPKLFDVHITLDGKDRINVVPVWSCVDRPTTTSWAFRNTAAHRRLAERFKKAMLEGAVFHNISVAKDIYGCTYVQADSCVWARRLNKDLKKLGY